MPEVSHIYRKQRLYTHHSTLAGVVPSLRCGRFYNHANLSFIGSMGKYFIFIVNNKQTFYVLPINRFTGK